MNGCKTLLLHDGVGVHVLYVDKQTLDELLVLHQEVKALGHALLIHLGIIELATVDPSLSKEGL